MSLRVLRQRTARQINTRLLVNGTRSSAILDCLPYQHQHPASGTMPHRKYVSKIKSTSTLIPSSQQLLSGTALQEYSKAKDKMEVAIGWFRKECATHDIRASGRVTAALLDPVRVALPGSSELVRLEELASIGVRNGSTLVVTAFDEDTMKYIESALYNAKMLNVVPQRRDRLTINLPIPKPTVESRKALYATAHRQAEETRVQIRNVQQAGVKHGNFKKHSTEIDEFQKLADRSIREVDEILAQLKKSTGKT